MYSYFIKINYMFDDAFFSTGTGQERVGVAGLDPDCWRAGMQAFELPGLQQDRCCVAEPGYDCYSVDRPALDVALLCKNNQDGGSARASPVAAPMPKSVSF